MIYVETARPLNATNITVIDAPDVFLAPDEKAGDLLLHFYCALGWNGKDMLDPCKVRTTKEVYNMLYDRMLERYPDPVSIGMFMANCGPGTEDYIPLGKVYLIEGWIIPDQKEGGDVHAS